jgi:uncharacterized protein (DUF1810 family)
MDHNPRMVMADPFDLDRFVAAQEGAHARALAELKRGRKESHWMWYVFPQIAGLGQSSIARRFAISGRDEARAYLDHPILGLRLRECTRTINALAGRTAEEIFGAVDAVKLRSSMTLFKAVGDSTDPFTECLAKYFAGAKDDATLNLLAAPRPDRAPK